MAAQNYSNHTKFAPSFHFVSFPAAALVLAYFGNRLFDDPNLANGAMVGLALVSLSALLHSRLFAMGVQDRVIRLEERLRLRDVLPDAYRPRIAELTTAQLIALRFASDEELPPLVERVLAGEFANTKEIKQAVQHWRADHQRI